MNQDLASEIAHIRKEYEDKAIRALYEGGVYVTLNFHEGYGEDNLHPDKVDWSLVSEIAVL